MHRDAPLAMYDMTIPVDRFLRDELIDLLKLNCKRWAFQKECGESGYEHWQVRCSFGTKKRPSSAIIWFNKHVHDGHISPTSNATSLNGDEFYVTKEETRVEGPWTDRDEVITESMVPRRFRGEPEFRPMQRDLIDLLSNPPDDRSVNCLIDPMGDVGKTFIAGYLATKGLAKYVPAMESFKDYLQFIMSFKPYRVYIIDWPRAISGRAQAALFTAIEQLKAGYVYDLRYHGKDRWQEPAHVWIFTNKEPNTKHLTMNRWKFFHIVDNRLVSRAITKLVLPQTAFSGASL